MFRKQHPLAGSRPGTLQVAPNSPPTRVRILKYSPDSVSDQTLQNVRDIGDHVSPGCFCWIDIQGFQDVSTLEDIGREFDIHPLALEAVVNVPQRPNVESFPKQLLIISRILALNPEEQLHVSQLGIILGSNYILTFHDQPSDLLAPVRHRIGLPTSRLRTHGTDYLAYAIVDTVVDASYPVLESLGEQIESLEKQLIMNPRPELIQHITALKNQLLNLRRTIWAQREAVHKLQMEETDLVGDVVRTFLRDTYDHCVQTADVVEMYREMSSGLVNTYTSSVAHRSNEVMKVLTIVSTIFVPLTFLAGIYGMNFENMPELNFRWSYPLLLFSMGGIAAFLLMFFSRIGWLSTSPIVDPNEVPLAPLPVHPSAVEQQDNESRPESSRAAA